MESGRLGSGSPGGVGEARGGDDVVRLRRTWACWMFGANDFAGMAWFLSVVLAIIMTIAWVNGSWAEAQNSSSLALIPLVLAAAAAVTCEKSGPRVEGSILRFGVFRCRRLDLSAVIGIGLQNVEVNRFPSKVILFVLEDRRRVCFTTSACLRAARRQEWIDQLVVRTEKVRPADSAPVMLDESDWPPVLGILEGWDQRNQRWAQRKLTRVGSRGRAGR